MERYLIWDFGGTLGRRNQGMADAMLTVVRSEAPDSKLTRDDVRRHMPKGLPWENPAIGHTYITTADEWWHAYSPCFAAAFASMGFLSQKALAMGAAMRDEFPRPSQFSLFTDTLPALSCLSDKGWTHVVLSNHVPELAAIVDALGLGPWIVSVFASGLIGYEKPHPHAYQSVTEELGPDNTYCMVGDSHIADVQGAEAVGIPAILVRNPSRKAKHRAEALTDIPRLLDEAVPD